MQNPANQPNALPSTPRNRVAMRARQCGVRDKGRKVLTRWGCGAALLLLQHQPADSPVDGLHHLALRPLGPLEAALRKRPRLCTTLGAAGGAHGVLNLAQSTTPTPRGKVLGGKTMVDENHQELLGLVQHQFCGVHRCPPNIVVEMKQTQTQNT